MGYFGVGKEIRRLKREIRGYIYDDLRLFSVIPIITAMFVWLIYKEEGKIVFPIVYALLITLVIFFLIVVFNIKGVMRDNYYDEEGNYVNNEYKLDILIKKSNIISTFDQSNNYKNYVKREGVCEGKFIKNMVYIRDRVSKLEDRVDGDVMKKLQNMILMTLIIPKKYEDIGKVLSRIAEIEGLLEDKKQIKEFNKSVKDLEEFKIWERELEKEDLDSFIEEVNR